MTGLLTAQLDTMKRSLKSFERDDDEEAENEIMKQPGNNKSDSFDSIKSASLFFFLLLLFS